MKHFSLYLTLCEINELHLQTLPSVFVYIKTELLTKSLYSVHQEDPATEHCDQVSIVFLSPRANYDLTFQFSVTPPACSSPNSNTKFPNIKNIILSNVAFSTELRVLKFSLSLSQYIFLLQAQIVLSLYFMLFISFQCLQHSSVTGQADRAWEIYTA
jgi:hypothetical protein